MTFGSRNICNLWTSERRPSTLDHQMARISARATKGFDMPLRLPSARTCFSDFHQSHGVLHLVNGATVATVRSMSLRSSLLRAVCIPWQTPLMCLGHKRTHNFLSVHNCQFSQKNMPTHVAKKKPERTGSQVNGIHRCRRKSMKFDAFLEARQTTRVYVERMTDLLHLSTNNTGLLTPSANFEPTCHATFCGDHGGLRTTRQCRVDFDVFTLPALGTQESPPGLRSIILD